MYCACATHIPRVLRSWSDSTYSGSGVVMTDTELDQVRIEFVENVSIETIKLIIDCVLKDRIISAPEKESILEKSTVRADQARRLLDTVKNKGTKARAMFVSHIERLDPRLHQALWPSAKSAVENPTEESTATLIPSTETFWKKKQNKDDVYPADKRAMSNRVALLITNIQFTNDKCTRHGAEKDEENMEKLLKGLGYEVLKYTDLTGEQMDKAFSDFSKHPKLKDTDSVVVVVMSHGSRENIYGVNHTKETPDEFAIDKMYKHLDTVKCRDLMDKPKVIIIQACRGDECGSVLVTDGSQVVTDDLDGTATPGSTTDLEEDVIRYVHKEKDFTCLSSCTVDSVSYRHTTTGSVFINSVVKLFNQHAHEDHVEKLFTKVMVDVGKFSLQYRKQMPSKDRCTLTKKFYFYPGLINRE